MASLFLAAGLRLGLQAYLHMREAGRWSSQTPEIYFPRDSGALYFSGSGALGIQHVDRFASSLATDPDAEVPISMVALVATAIHNSLMEWHRHTLTPGVLRTQLWGCILEKIKSNKPVFFHRMMSDLYRDARAATAGSIQKTARSRSWTFRHTTER
ncbi:hypothetical protein OE88DRAFT_1726741 [Heliocybe sulcata]|uniref:DUF6532 domain-containing protein n=1 Tax=Heliocybe sulcata TaxID=5364 RepID=A0A5C3MYI0_9AGAM|nr:hypothetical protein OE88DRAFT_1726741 [Heliocybe sulcata]